MKTKFGKSWVTSSLTIALLLIVSCASLASRESAVFQITVRFADDQSPISGVPVEFGTEGNGLLGNPRYKEFGIYSSDERGRLIVTTQDRIRNAIVFHVTRRPCVWEGAGYYIPKDEIDRENPVDVEIRLLRLSCEADDV